jgi:DNA-directed RNA polymerase subunit RPC12/RpoP
MAAFTEWTCQKCRRRFGWSDDRGPSPTCPRCGSQISPDALAETERELASAREMILARTPETKSGRAEAVWVQDWRPGACIFVGGKHVLYPKYDGLWRNPWSRFDTTASPLRAASDEEAVENYRRWLAGDTEFVTVEPERRETILRSLSSLRGKRLGCWRHDGSCHARVLADFVNALSSGDSAVVEGT